MAQVVDFGLQKHKIKLNSEYSENLFNVVAGDTGRSLEIQLLDSEGLVQNTTGLNLRLNAIVEDKATFTDATLIDAATGLYRLNLSNGMFLAPGHWQFQWRITDAAGAKLHGFVFMGKVGSNISEGGSQATNFYLNLEDLKAMQEDLVNGTFDFEVLETNIAEKLTDLETQYAPKLTEVTAQLVQTEQGLNEKIELKANEADLEVERARINNLSTMAEGSTTGDAELFDIRVGVDGTTYPSAGQAVRQTDLKIVESLDALKKSYLPYALQSYNSLTGQDPVLNWHPYIDYRMQPLSYLKPDIADAITTPASFRSANTGAPVPKDVSSGYEIGIASHMFVSYNLPSNLKVGAKVYVYVKSNPKVHIGESGTSRSSLAFYNGPTPVSYNPLIDVAEGWVGGEYKVPDEVITANASTVQFVTLRLDNRVNDKIVVVEQIFISDKPIAINQLFNEGISKTVAQVTKNSQYSNFSGLGREDENILLNSFGNEVFSGTFMSPTPEYYYSLTYEKISSGDGKITIKPGGYLFHRIKPYKGMPVGGKLNVFLQVLGERPNGSSLTIHEVDTAGVRTGEPIVNAYDNFWSGKSPMIDTDTSYIDIRIDNRSGIGDLVITSLLANKYGGFNAINIALNSKNNAIVGTGKIAKYVSLTGSDMNTGDSKNTPYATFQKAIDEGAQTILAERGTYFGQSITASIANSEVEIMPSDNRTYTDLETPPKKIELRGSAVLKNWTLHSGNVWKHTYNGGYNWQAVFVDKTLPVMNASSRPAPNAQLWEGNDRYSDKLLKPVLTLQECLETIESFFWDGTTVYMNPKNGIVTGKEYNAIEIFRGLSLSNLKSLKMVDVSADFFFSAPMTTVNNSRLDLYGCQAGHSGTTDGFNLDYSIGSLFRCQGFKNRNDGFNAHFDADITLFDCDGFNNYDDGISFHEICRGVIYGGKWFGNAKGGIIHVNASLFNVYDAICYDNVHGIYFGGDSAILKHRLPVVIKGCKTYGNTNGIYIGEAYDAEIIDCLTYKNGSDIVVIGSGSANIKNTIIEDGNTGITSSGSGDIFISGSKINDHINGIVHSGSGKITLERNDILYNVTAINSDKNIVVLKRNNLYGNTTDYLGTAISTVDRAKNVSIPTI